MAKKIGGNITVRGEMKRGRIVLLDDVQIENNSLLDITVVRTPDQRKMEEKASARRAGKTAAEPIRFAFKGKKFTADPIELFRGSSKTPTPITRFDGYETTIPLSSDLVQTELAEFLLSVKRPSAALSKAFSKAVRQRKRCEFSVGTATAEKIRRELELLVTEQDVADEVEPALWYSAITLVTGDGVTIGNSITELFEFAPELELLRTTRKKKVGATEAQKIRDQATTNIETSLRPALFGQLIDAAKRARRSVSGSGPSVKLIRQELTEISKRLELARSHECD